MKAEDLTAYFTKKIAKPLAYDLWLNDGSSHGNRRFYLIEPTALRDGVLHVLVSLKSQIKFGTKENQSEHIGEAEIPLRDDDTIEAIYDMAIAAAEFRDNIESSYAEVIGNREKLRRAQENLDRRLEDVPSGPKP